eukprot:1147411-Pelagomonas_calceolata.AAC.3
MVKLAMQESTHQVHATFLQVQQALQGFVGPPQWQGHSVGTSICETQGGWAGGAVAGAHHYTNLQHGPA